MFLNVTRSNVHTFGLIDKFSYTIYMVNKVTPTMGPKQLLVDLVLFDYRFAWLSVSTKTNLRRNATRKMRGGVNVDVNMLPSGSTEGLIREINCYVKERNCRNLKNAE